MARGWESKAVADQIEAAEERPSDEERMPSDLSPEMRARFERIASLRLSRSRTLEQLEKATNPAYREMLRSALGAVERELEELRDTG